MNLRVWEDALDRAGLREKYARRRRFPEGFSQEIPNHRIGDLRWYTPPNHKLADWAKEEIISNLRKEAAAGRMFGLFSHRTVAKQFPFFISSPLGAVANSDGLIRPINDLSFPHDQPGTPSVNLFIEKEDFRNYGYSIGKGLPPNPNQDGPMALFIRTRFRQQLTPRYTNHFGGVAGCGSFGRPADAWKEVMMANST
ncbi:hypothetical protein PSTT_14425 [Puccinia striiformis]|uniref:Uncharacterized protein n=1 Tax=Puccinia striiformis TaxID=27350 RepID=A0A2S4UMC9_9BASI|nr:hypothetical protein PSTT_14425 [Puccinia striiformis]